MKSRSDEFNKDPLGTRGPNSMEKIILHYVDAFTTEPFSGNPAAVTLLGSSLPDVALQNIAMELNLSETAFLVKKGDAHYNLRWFTPNGEVDLCGHATLASAHWLWESGIEPNEKITFDYKLGTLYAFKNQSSQIRLDFPSEPPVEDAAIEGDLTSILGVKPVWTGRNRIDYLAEVEDEQVLARLNPNLSKMAELSCRGVIVTAASKGQFQFKSRAFYPKFNIPEDPVTGSAHCCLAPYWSKKLGLTKMKAYQGLRRGGVIEVEVKGQRVDLIGTAVTTTRVELLVPCF